MRTYTMFKRIAGLAAVVMALGVAGRAGAQVSYTEGADLANVGTTALGTLDTYNTITGQIAPIGAPFGGPVSGDFADAFTVVVPSGYRLSSLTVHIYVYQSNVASPARFRCTSPGAVNSFTISGYSTSGNLVAPAGGLAAGTYSFVVENLFTPQFTASSAQIGYIIAMQTINCSVPPTPTATGQDCGILVSIPAGSPTTEVWRSPTGFGFGSLIGTIPSGQTTLFDAQNSGTACYYRTRVLAANSACGVDTSYSNQAYSVAQAPSTPAPVTLPYDNGCLLRWSSSNGATEIEVTLMSATSPPVAIYTDTVAGDTLAYSLPSTVNPFLQLAADRRAFWYIRSRKVCGGSSSGWAETFTNDFTASGRQDGAGVGAMNGPCSVILYWQAMPGATYFTLSRQGPDGTVTFTNPTMPYFEDTTAAVNTLYTYRLAAVGCNTVVMARDIYVQRTPTGGAGAPVRVAAGQTATIAAALGGPILTVPGYSVSWKRGGVSATDAAATAVVDGDMGGRVSGATTPTLTITGVGPNDADTYWCTLTGACGSTSYSVTLFTSEGCRADFDRSGTVQVADIFSFLNAWFAGCP